MPGKKYAWWILTLNQPDEFSPTQPIHRDVRYIRGQLEEGSTTARRHWQIVVATKIQVSLTRIRTLFGSTCHAEPTRSAAARDYVWKDETAIAGTRFEFGELPHRRNKKTDWSAVRQSAISGKLEEIPDNVFIQHYRSLKSIRADYSIPISMERETFVYWGPTGTGKSRTAWDNAGMDAYCKDPRTKWWCGYRNQENIVIDEFRGSIDISHLLRWLDRYPVLVETKGSSTPLCAKKIWITSNLNPRQWYPDTDELTIQALERRLTIIHFDNPFS